MILKRCDIFYFFVNDIYNNFSEKGVGKMATGNALKRGVYVVAAKRTPFGTFGGTLKGHSPTELQVKSRICDSPN